MCDPVTLGVAAMVGGEGAAAALGGVAGAGGFLTTTMAAIGPSTAASAAGIFGAIGSLGSGILGGVSGLMNYKALNAQADLQIQKGEFDAARAADKFRRTQGQAIANIGATGISLDSFGDVLADNVMESALEQKAIMYGAYSAARNLRSQASGALVSAGAAFIGGTFGAAGQYMAGQARALALDKGIDTSGFETVGYNRISARYRG